MHLFFRNRCEVAGLLIILIGAIALAICSENIEVLLCYIPTPLNGEIIIRDGGYSQVPHAVLPGTKVFLQCNAGFGAAVTSAICLEDGQWSESIETCYRKQTIEVSERTGCPNPHLRHGELVTQTRGGVQVRHLSTDTYYLPGAKVAINCQPGYHVKSGQAIETICLGDGNWTATIGQCEPLMLEERINNLIDRGDTPAAAPPSKTFDIALSPLCEESPIFPNGVVSVGTSELFAQRKTICFSGYTLMGVDSAICGDDGKWAFAGYCSKDCGPTPSIKNGYVLSGPFSTGTSRKILCASGYTLTGPETIMCQEDGLWSTPGLCTGRKLFIIPGPLSFDEAYSACDKAGAKMASVKTCVDDSAIRSLMLGNGKMKVRNAWIGLRRATPGSERWRWVSDGTYLESDRAFRAWWPGYPDNKSDHDDCVIYQSWEDFASGWNDIPCAARTWISSAARVPFVSQNIGVVCEKNLIP